MQDQKQLILNNDLCQVLTASGWELVLYDCMRASANSHLAIPYIFTFFLLSNYIIANLFIGAILASMSPLNDADRRAVTKEMRRHAEAHQRISRQAQLFVNNRQAYADRRKIPSPNLTTLQEVMTQRDSRELFEESPVDGPRFAIEVTNSALGLLSPQSNFRRILYSIVKNPLFDQVILVVIAYSCILLTMMNYETQTNDAWSQFFKANDVFFIVVFTIEFTLKVSAVGFIWCDNIELMLGNKDDLKKLMIGDFGPPPYMYDAWNYLDLVVLMVQYVNFFFSPDGPFKVLRLLRAFRPLRMINRVAGLKLVITALIDALPAFGNVVVLLISIFLVFAILGMSLFMGKFYSCNDAVSEYEGGSDKHTCYGHNTLNDYWTPKVNTL